MLQYLKDKIHRTLYLLGYFLVLIAAKVLFRVQVEGRENVPAHSELIVVSTHRSYWDPPLIGIALGPKNQVHFVAREGLTKNPLFSLPVRLFSTIINRDNFGKSDLRKALREKRIVCILPEGTTQQVSKPKKGAVKLAEKTGHTFVPVKIEADPYPPRFPNLFPKIRLIIEKPFTVDDLETELPGGEDLSPEAYYDGLTRLLMEKL